MCLQKHCRPSVAANHAERTVALAISSCAANFTAIMSGPHGKTASTVMDTFDGRC